MTVETFCIPEPSRDTVKPIFDLAARKNAVVGFAMLFAGGYQYFNP